jgi:hypothetical protein
MNEGIEEEDAEQEEEKFDTILDSFPSHGNLSSEEDREEDHVSEEEENNF